MRFIDEYGLRRLTMQRLGAYLGVEGMALYRYVPGREALLDGVVETVVDELLSDPRLDVHADAWVEATLTDERRPGQAGGPGRWYLASYR